jgi:hypothetical protein
VSDFGEYTRPVARKEYRCEWCGEKILKGERHFKYAGIWEGDWQNWRMHGECKDDADMNGDMQDGFTPYEAERPAKLAPAAESNRTIPQTARTCTGRI